MTFPYTGCVVSCTAVRADLQTLVSLLSPCSVDPAHFVAVDLAVQGAVDNGTLTEREARDVRRAVDDARRAVVRNELGAMDSLRMVRRSILDGYAEKLRRCIPP